MPAPQPPGARDPAAVVLGYFSFSSGGFDPAVWRAMNAVFAGAEPADAHGPTELPDTAARVESLLARRLADLAASEAAFRDPTQARLVIELVFERLLPGYRRFHADLLEHQPPGGIERPYFVMAAAQAVLAAAATGDDTDPQAIVAAAIERLNDYAGWRPVAVLENGRLSEPYAHERVRPIPLFIAGAGPAEGRYAAMVATAIEILRQAPAPLLRQADFDLDLLEELAVDPRAFDFLHPAASRPNYLFGMWDPARIDENGCYCRMVLQQVTLDGVLSWPEQGRADGERPAELESQLRWESGAVLAGVVLMAAGLSGHGPGARQAGLPLAELLPRIAGYRDEFYRWLLTTLPPAHGRRLEEEARRLHQPFGGVRRHINAVLAGRRARQVENVALAAVFARLGRAAAAERLAGEVPAASARMFARITGRVVAASRGLVLTPTAVERSLDELDAATQLLLRAVECGAAVDPWNILGMSGQFPLHEPGGESLTDPRVDDLVNVTESILDGYAAAWRQAELAGTSAVAARAASALDRLAAWWDRFATTTVSGVPHVSGREIAGSTREVIAALERRRATPATPPGFWRQEVAEFTSPRTHAQAAEALLGEGDLDGAQGLLVHWASLLEGEAVERTGGMWLTAATRWVDLAAADASPEGRLRLRRFLEFMEANTAGLVDLVETAAAGREPGDRRGDPLDDRDGDPDEDDQAVGEESVASAYESMVWRDSADDGVDGGMIDVDAPGAVAGGPAALEDAAELLAGTIRLLGRAVTAWCAADAAAATQPTREEIDAVIGWRHSLRRLRRGLVAAANVVAGRDQAPPPGMSPTEFDRLRWQRDAAAERLVDAAVRASETLWILSARLHVGRRGSQPPPAGIGRLFASLFTGDAATARSELERLSKRLAGKAVLYVPLSRGGRPDRIARARSRERLLERLAGCLPRVGLVKETAAVVQLAKALESRRPPGAASVSEFDRVFEAATGALVERIVESAATPTVDAEAATQRILDGLALLVPRLLETWMTHARQLRLSVLERVRDDKAFAVTRQFIEDYGSGLFTQHVLTPASLRGILRGGVRHHIERLIERAEPEAFAGEEPRGDQSRPRQPTRLIEDLASGVLPMNQAVARLRLVLESIAENHAEYRDWNSTTTQSDRGECLHILLDSLRVKAEYDRIAWTLRPVNMAHRVLARRGAVQAAESWRQRMRDETAETAAELVARIAGLEAQWGVRLASIGDRVRRPFTAALEQDELEALVDPAAAELATGKPVGAGAALEAKAETFRGVASGSGVEVPEWLERLSAAVDRAAQKVEAGGFAPRSVAAAERTSLPGAVPWVPMAWDAVHAALEN